MDMAFRPIETMTSAFKEPKDIAFVYENRTNGTNTKTLSVIRTYNEFEEGLEDLKEFSHSWLDEQPATNR